MIARTLSTGQVLEDSLISVIAGLDPAIHHLWMNDDKAKPGHIACHVEVSRLAASRRIGTCRDLAGDLVLCSRRGILPIFRSRPFEPETTRPRSRMPTTWQASRRLGR